MSASWFDGVPIFMYHEIAEPAQLADLARKTQRGYILLREDFERQMAYIADNGFSSISLRQLLDWAQTGAPIPKNSVLITFDDGFAGNYRHAFPVLQKHGLVATFFVVTNRINDEHRLTWAEAREMQRHGMAIESHTANHPLLSTLTEARTREELLASKEAIEDKLGGATQFISLPNGDSNPFYERLAREVGYLGGCGSQFGLNGPSTDCFFWRRIAVKQGLSIDRFRDLVQRSRGTMLNHAAKASGKAAIARILGKKNYDRLYNAIFGVEEQDASKRMSGAEK